MPSFDEITKEEWGYLKGKFEWEFKTELPTNTYTDTYIKFLINEKEIIGRERTYDKPKSSRYFLWR
jgi:hypothetical protein